MKRKVALITFLFVLFNSVFCYADYEYDISINDIPIEQSQLIESYVSSSVSDDGNIYFESYDSRSGSAVAIGGAVASSILALATKCGISFLSTKAMDEFLYRFTGLPSAKSLLPSLSESVKNSVDGVINFSRSLLDSLGTLFYELVTSKDISFYETGGVSIPVLTSSLTENTIINLSRAVSFSVYSTHVGTSDGRSIVDKEFTILNDKFRVRSYSVKADTYNYSSALLQKYDSSSDSWSTLCDSYIYSGDSVFAYPVIRKSGSDYRVGVCFVYKSSSETSYTKGKGMISSSTLGLYKSLDFVENSIGAVIGDAWSDGHIEDDEGSSGVSVKVPSNAEQLVGLPSNGVTSSPSYDTWSPGVSVVVPGVDNPKVEITTDDIDVPGTDTDDPDVDVDKPSSAWDWLKALLQKILDLIQAVVDWLSSFWDKLLELLSSLLQNIFSPVDAIVEWLSDFWVNLLEFIKSIFIPSDGYFVDKFNDILISIKERIPGLDIDRLKGLAVGERKFEDVYATFFGVRCLVVRGSVVNNVLSWSKPIIQGLIAIFLLLYNYNQIYKLIRGGSVVGSSRSIDERGK